MFTSCRNLKALLYYKLALNGGPYADAKSKLVDRNEDMSASEDEQAEMIDPVLPLVLVEEEVD